MRKTITLLCVLIGGVVNAQFSILPQVGLENSRTTIRSNEFASFSPKDMQFAPRLAVRMSYKFKTGHGLFLGAATGRQDVAFRFTDPKAAGTIYTATSKGLQLHIEGGYQYSIKPIKLGKAVSAKGTSHLYGGGEERRCISKLSCGQHSSVSHCNKTFNRTPDKNKGSYLRIVPSAGLAFRPSGAEKIETEVKGGQTTYAYRAGWNTAVIAGAVFEFGSLKQPGFIVSVNYLKGLGNNEGTVNTVVNGKPNATSLRSKTSGFNVSIGVPINLKKNKSAKKRECLRSNYHQYRCGQYRTYLQ